MFILLLHFRASTLRGENNPTQESKKTQSPSLGEEKPKLSLLCLDNIVTSPPQKLNQSLPSKSPSSASPANKIVHSLLSYINTKSKISPGTPERIKQERENNKTRDDEYVPPSKRLFAQSRTKSEVSDKATVTPKTTKSVSNVYKLDQFLNHAQPASNDARINTAEVENNIDQEYSEFLPKAGALKNNSSTDKPFKSPLCTSSKIVNTEVGEKQTTLINNSKEDTEDIICLDDRNENDTWGTNKAETSKHTKFQIGESPVKCKKSNEVGQKLSSKLSANQATLPWSTQSIKSTKSGVKRKVVKSK